MCCGPQSCCGGGWEDEWYRGKQVYLPTETTEPAYTCCGVVPLGMIRDRGNVYSYDYEYTLPLCLQLALCPRGAALTTCGAEPGADLTCCAHLLINLGCCCVQQTRFRNRPDFTLYHPIRENIHRRWICLWEWRYPLPRPLAGSTGLESRVQVASVGPDGPYDE